MQEWLKKNLSQLILMTVVHLSFCLLQLEVVYSFGNLQPKNPSICKYCIATTKEFQWWVSTSLLSKHFLFSSSEKMSTLLKQNTHYAPSLSIHKIVVWKRLRMCFFHSLSKNEKWCMNVWICVCVFHSEFDWLDQNIFRSVPIPQSESDSFVKLMCVEVEGMGEVLLALTTSGRVRFFNVKTLELLFTSNEVSIPILRTDSNVLVERHWNFLWSAFIFRWKDWWNILCWIQILSGYHSKDFVFVSGDNQFVCSTSTGQLLSINIPVRFSESPTPGQEAIVCVSFSLRNSYSCLFWTCLVLSWIWDQSFFCRW